ncbi:MAG TPA: twin-arginine translocase TatA/TatE family subunit [Candidatus Dormibacteraeota bacterium]|nr:twin-arginine translocase TatA/TatE family subunit [Candidatus Dormibacteraeota bacterium]
MPFGFHPLWLVVLLVIVLIIFGPGKLPELGGALGRGIREFRKTSSELSEEMRSAIDETRGSATDPGPTTASTTTAEPGHVAKTEPEAKS